MTKVQLRKKIKSLFSSDNFSSQNFKNQSNTICQKIINTDVFLTADYIFAYMPMFDEVDILPVIQKAKELNKKVLIPKINLKKEKMHFYIDNENTIKGAYGILEPEKSKKINLKRIIKHNKCLCLVPGRAFTKDGKRLGRGKGYYDKYFSKIQKVRVKENIIFYGICFDEQIVLEEDLECNKYDIKMDKVISCLL